MFDHICLRPVLHNGKTYSKGSSIELTAKEAAPLIAGKIILSATVPGTLPALDPAPTMIDPGADEITVEIEEGAPTVENEPDAPTVETVMAAIRALAEGDYTKSDPRKPLTSAISEAMPDKASVPAALRDEAWRLLLEEGFTVPAGADTQ